MHEVDIMERVKNPKLVHFYGFWSETSDKKNLSVIMDLCQGGDLDELLHTKKTKKLTMTERFEILKDICEGIIGFHSTGIIHRDIKPLNVLFHDEINPKERIPSAKLSDYGECYNLLSDSHKIIKKKYEENDEDYDFFTDYMGTIPYSAPEILEGDLRNLTAKADIYSFGVLMWEIFVEKRPFFNNEGKAVDIYQVTDMVLDEGKNPKNFQKFEYLENTPAEIDNLIDKCLNFSHEERPDASNLYNELVKIQEDNHLTNKHW